MNEYKGLRILNAQFIPIFFSFLYDNLIAIEGVPHITNLSDF